MPEQASRRTVVIRGDVVERYSPRRTTTPRRPRNSRQARVSSRPDRIALWAVLLGILLVLVAATSSHAAMVHF
jgi:hypothetical protein